MQTIIGLAETRFTTKEGTEITGKTIYLAEPIDPKRGEGESAERVFLSTARLNALGFIPALGMKVEVLYNRYGKISTFRLIEEEVLID